MGIDVEQGMPVANVMLKYAVTRPMVNRAISEREEETGETITRRRAPGRNQTQRYERGYITVVWRMAVPATCAITGAPGGEQRMPINWSQALISLRATCEAGHIKVMAQSFGGFHSEDYQSDFNPEPYRLLLARLREEPLWGV